MAIFGRRLLDRHHLHHVHEQFLNCYTLGKRNNISCHRQYLKYNPRNGEYVSPALLQGCFKFAELAVKLRAPRFRDILSPVDALPKGVNVRTNLGSRSF